MTPLTIPRSPDYETYAARLPFPHRVLDGYFDIGVCRRVVGEMPPLDDHRWKHHRTSNEDKWEGSDPSMWGQNTNLMLEALQGDPFRTYLTALTGIPDLHASTYGGGYHVITEGGFLNSHVDFNALRDDQDDVWYRRLNVLVFLNDIWYPEWGGTLYLGEEEERSLPVLPAPMGRIVIFTTSEHSRHGHPEPIVAPHVRRSLAVYYFTKEAPEWYEATHDTVFS